MTQARDLADGKFDTNTLVVDAAGNKVGIGTASPDTIADIAGSGVPLEIDSTNSNTYKVQFKNNGTVTSYLGTASNAFYFGNSSAAQLARLDSDGLKFGTDSAAANALDDYEEGTWTVNIKKGGSALAVGTRYGNYVRVGKLLWISFYWLNTSISTSGSSDYTVEGMPFNVDFGGSSGYQFVPAGYFNIGSTNIFNSEPHRWQANATDALTMYGASSTDNVSSGLLQFHGTGVLQVA